MIFSLETPTKAIKAKNLFLKAGIQARIIKLDDKSVGCTHGVEIDDERMLDCITILRNNNIKYQARSSDGLS